MSRRESDREDLLREATALVERAELKIEGQDDPVTCGFRRDGSASLFFGADSVYQFNVGGELRRAYFGGLLYKAEAGRLVSLRRERTASETALVRHELSSDELAGFMAALDELLARLRSESSRWTVLGQVPSDVDVAERIRQWLATLPACIGVASRPNVR